MTHREKKGKEDPSRREERKGIATIDRPDGPLIWCHAASVGEALSLLDMIKRLLDIRPDIHVLMTTGTLTSARLMGKRLPNRAFHQYIPLDHPAWVSRFMDHWQPDCVLWAESELWPNLLHEIRLRNLPAALVNARISDRSFNRWKRFQSIAETLLSSFQLCLAQSTQDAQRLVHLGASNVKAPGNLKYGSAPLPDDRPSRKALEDRIAQRPVWLFSSTHQGEDEIAINTHKELLRKHKQLLTIIVPRHPHRGDDIAALARQAGLTAQQRSKSDLPDHETDIFIADTMGELGLFYRLCPVSVIGGSFIAHGGHNPIEPAQLGTAIIYGPHMFNFRAICSDFAKAKAAIQIENGNQLPHAIDNLLTNADKRQKLATAAAEFADINANIVDQYLNLLTPILPAREQGSAPPSKENNPKEVQA